MKRKSSSSHQKGLGIGEFNGCNVTIGGFLLPGQPQGWLYPWGAGTGCSSPGTVDPRTISAQGASPPGSPSHTPCLQRTANKPAPGRGMGEAISGLHLLGSPLGQGWNGSWSPPNQAGGGGTFTKSEFCSAGGQLSGGSRGWMNS